MPQLCLGRRPAWVWLGELAAEQPQAGGREAGVGVSVAATVLPVEGVSQGNPSLGGRAAPFSLAPLVAKGLKRSGCPCGSGSPRPG